MHRDMIIRRRGDDDEAGVIILIRHFIIASAIAAMTADKRDLNAQRGLFGK